MQPSNEGTPEELHLVSSRSAKKKARNHSRASSLFSLSESAYAFFVSGVVDSILEDALKSQGLIGLESEDVHARWQRLHIQVLVPALRIGLGTAFDHTSLTIE